MPLDSDSRRRGAVLGGALGVLLGGTATEIAARASREAAQQGKAVTYRSADGSQLVEATPLGLNPQTHCTMVRERVYRNGQLVKDQVKDVCREI